MRYKTMPGKEIKTIGKLSKKMEPTISIITPFYNGEKTLMETANSIFSQTYPFFEWVIINDGSTSKDSKKALDDLSKMDKRVRVLHKENGGPAAARDYGIERTNPNTKYVYFLDCDDIIENNMIEMMYWTLETHNEASFAYPSMINFGSNKYYWEPYFTLEEELVTNVMCINTMIKKKDLLEVGGFGIKEKAMFEDWNLWLKLLAKEKVPIRINPLSFWYRTSNTGEWSRSLKNRKAQALINKTVKTVKKDVDVIQYPRMSKEEATDTKDMVLPSYKNDNAVMFIINNTAVDDENIMIYETLKRLSKEGYKLTVISTQPVISIMRQDLQEFADEFYDLSNFLDFKDYPTFVNYLIKSRCIENIVISDETFGYALIPTIREYNNKVKIHLYLDSKKKTISNFSSLTDSVLTTTKNISEELNSLAISNQLIKVDKTSKKQTQIDRIKIREKYKVPSTKTVLAFIDNISYENRPQVFLEIAKSLLQENNNLFFIISGDGQMEEEIRLYLEDNNLVDDFLILEEQKNPTEIIKLSDLVVNTSAVEGLSLINYQAISNGTPLVAANLKNVSDYVPEKCGLLVDYMENSNQVEYEEYSKRFIEKINSILENKDKYQEDTKSYAYNKNELYNQFTAELIKMFNTNETVKKIVSCSEIIYAYYTNQLRENFRENYLTYYKDFQNIIPRETIDRSKFAIFKRKMRGFSLRNRVENEMHYIFLKLEFFVNAIKSLVMFIKNFLLSLIYLIPIVLVFLKILIKLGIKLLVTIKHKIVK